MACDAGWGAGFGVVPGIGACAARFSVKQMEPSRNGNIERRVKIGGSILFIILNNNKIVLADKYRHHELLPRKDPRPDPIPNENRNLL